MERNKENFRLFIDDICLKIKRITRLKLINKIIDYLKDQKADQSGI